VLDLGGRTTLAELAGVLGRAGAHPCVSGVTVGDVVAAVGRLAVSRAEVLAA